METHSPPHKRSKIENAPIIEIKAILSDEFEQRIPLASVYISKIQNKRHISIIMKELSQMLPLVALQHLKRVRKNEVIVCKTEDVSDDKSLLEFLQDAQLSSEVIKYLCEKVDQVEVPAAPTKLRWQYEAMRKHWPCKFHPDKYLESLYNGTSFIAEEKQIHTKMAKLLLRMSSILEEEKPFGICVDPRSNSIVALAAGRTDLSPVMHCPMVLIDFVARTQNAGVWNTKILDEFLEEPSAVARKDESKTFAGITKRYFNFIKNYIDNQDINFGGERLKEKATKTIESLSGLEGSNNLEKYGPYLCTGYDVYLSQEPCLMCAMALVHSRVKRVFFVRRSQNGALISRLKLHTVRELNHHYEVFQCSEQNSEASSVELCTISTIER